MSHIRASIMLGNLPNGAVVLDRYGHAWQKAREFWYRSYGDDEFVSDWDAAMFWPFKVLHDLKECHTIVTDSEGNEKPCNGRGNRWAYDYDTESLVPACERHQHTISAMGGQP